MAENRPFPDGDVERAFLRLAPVAPPERMLTLRSHPMLAALRRAGTRHVLADSADTAEIRALVDAGDAHWEEVDGSTANQPLVRKVFDRYMEKCDVAAWAAELRAADPTLDAASLLAYVYALLCLHTAQDVVAEFASGRPWAASVQLHMGLTRTPDLGVRIGHAIRAVAPTAVVKIPLTPHRPECFFMARDLERAGVPVNFTSTFSARQAVAAAVLGDVTLTNIFMGRINQGLSATLLGEHVDLAAQRALRGLRRDHGAKTLLIVASVRDWQTFVYTAGCDVFTAPCAAIAGFLTQQEFAPEQITSRVDDSLLDRMAIDAGVTAALGARRIARLYEVEPEFVDFLVALRDSPEYATMRDGDTLVRRFESAGFGDFFYTPADAEWTEIRSNKLPDVHGAPAQRVALDTLYTLLADADFDKYQEEMDEVLSARIESQP